MEYLNSSLASSVVPLGTTGGPSLYVSNFGMDEEGLLSLLSSVVERLREAEAPFLSSEHVKVKIQRDEETGSLSFAEAVIYGPVDHRLLGRSHPQLSALAKCHGIEMVVIPAANESVAAEMTAGGEVTANFHPTLSCVFDEEELLSLGVRNPEALMEAAVEEVGVCCRRLTHILAARTQELLRSRSRSVGR